MATSSGPVRVRIAPSPTGDPHVGTAYVGLFNAAFARRHEGTFILRIEDTDKERSTAESERAILESLTWLGLHPDEGPESGGEVGPYRQSERTEFYRHHAKILVEKGTAYHCFCTRERLDEVRSRQKAAGTRLGYDGACRNLDRSEVGRRLAAGECSVVRLKMPADGVTTVDDLLRGSVAYQNALLDDQILLKSDGFPTYHLANVVDDHLMGVTHVIRAEEWIPSTPKHVMLYEAFGWELPVFIHLPLLRNPDKGKTKISKRKNPVSLLYYKQRGFLPEALLNFLALMGWSFPDEDREKFSLEEFFRVFDIERVSLGGPVFDLGKLEWLNGLYLRDLSNDELVDRLLRYLGSHSPWDEESLKRVVPLVQERMVVLSDIEYQGAFYHGQPLFEALVPSIHERGIEATKTELAALRSSLERGVVYWNRDELVTVVSRLSISALRLAEMVFGGERDELAETLFFKGRGATLKICQEAVDTLKKVHPKKVSSEELHIMLSRVAGFFEAIGEWNATLIEEGLRDLARGMGWKVGDVFMPVRIACTGRAQTPPLFDTLIVVGRDRCVRRLRTMMATLASSSS